MCTVFTWGLTFTEKEKNNYYRYDIIFSKFKNLHWTTHPVCLSGMETNTAHPPTSKWTDWFSLSFCRLFVKLAKLPNVGTPALLCSHSGTIDLKLTFIDPLWFWFACFFFFFGGGHVSHVPHIELTLDSFMTWVELSLENGKLFVDHCERLTDCWHWKEIGCFELLRRFWSLSCAEIFRPMVIILEHLI